MDRAKSQWYGHIGTSECTVVHIRGAHRSYVAESSSPARQAKDRGIMAVAKGSQSGLATGGATAHSGPPVSVILFAGGGLVLLLGGVASLTGPGLVVLGFIHWFLEFYVGVFRLVPPSIRSMDG